MHFNYFLSRVLLGFIGISLLGTTSIRQRSETISYASNLNSSVQSLLSTMQNEDTLYKDNYYATLYFSHLYNNFGSNTHGTCSYVSIGMLLSFYDSYWNDDVIPESYDATSSYSYVIPSTYDFEYPSFDADSPGIASEPWDDVAGLSTSEYLTYVSQNDSTHFQSKLISLSQTCFGSAKFESSDSPYGMTFSQLLGFLNYYFYDYRGFTTSDFTIIGENANESSARTYAITKINQGIPVLLIVSSPTLGGHALIAYDYDSKSDEIYVHPGWKDSSGNALTHVSLSSLGFTTINSAVSISVNSSHSHTNNYHSSRNIDVCSCMYSFPQVASISSGNYRDMTPTFTWKSLYKEKWFEQYNPYFKMSILKSNRTIFLTYSNITQKQYTLSASAWDDVIYNISGNTYYCHLELASDTYSYWGDYFYYKSFAKPKDYGSLPYIDPDEYGFADAYPADDYTKNTFVQHNTSTGFGFQTRRYRTGYIHNEDIVMSPIRSGINEAFIEYRFDTAVTRIDAHLSHWRELSNEWLSSSNGTATIQQYIDDSWVDVFDLLSDSTNLPRNRNSKTVYKVEFNQPAYRIRFHSSYNPTATNESNRGRICIGRLAFYESEYNLPLSGGELDYEPSSWNNTVVSQFLWFKHYLKEKTNCYSYAVNAQVNPNTNSLGFMQPGQASDKSIDTGDLLNTNYILSLISSDASLLGFRFQNINANEACPADCYKVAFVIDNQSPIYDYHWYRQNSDGSWSHKQGSQAVTKLDNSGKLIMDPRTADRNAGNGLNYNLFVGFFVIKPLNIYYS